MKLTCVELRLSKFHRALLDHCCQIPNVELLDYGAGWGNSRYRIRCLSCRLTTERRGNIKAAISTWRGLCGQLPTFDFSKGKRRVQIRKEALVVASSELPDGRSIKIRRSKKPALYKRMRRHFRNLKSISK